MEVTALDRWHVESEIPAASGIGRCPPRAPLNRHEVVENAVSAIVGIDHYEVIAPLVIAVRDDAGLGEVSDDNFFTAFDSLESADEVAAPALNRG